MGCFVTKKNNYEVYNEDVRLIIMFILKTIKTKNVKSYLVSLFVRI